MNRIVMTGATGNTGLHTLKSLKRLQPDLNVLTLVRASSDTSALKDLGVDVATCDLEAPDTYLPLIRPGDIFLETANLRYARQMLPHLGAAGVTRAFCVTTTGVFSKHHAYAALYRDIEQELRSSPVEVTILRPSMIYGNERDHNMHKLLQFIARFPVYPVFGNGQSLMQPVHVEDLAQGVATAVTNDATGEFNLAGPEALPYRALIDSAFRAVGKRGVMLFVPVRPVAALVGALQRVPGFPVSQEQVIRLQEDKAFDIQAARDTLHYRPRSFEAGIRAEAHILRDRGLL